MKAVYYISNSRTWGHVATQVWDILKQEGFLREHIGIIFSGQEVMGYRDAHRALARTLTHAIAGGIESIFFHDKLKGCYKDLVRKLGKELQIPIYKHQKLRNPKELEWKTL